MSANFTPGPWSACCIHLTPHYVFADEANTTICRIEINDPESDAFEPISGTVTLGQARANARLIAAAPELLEAAEQALEVFINQGWDDDLIAASKLKSTIAKATGKEIA